jgi:hypothetical protein
VEVPEITWPRNVTVIMQQHHHRSTSVALRASCNHTEEIYRRCDEALRAVGCPACFPLALFVVSGFLLQRNIMHSFAPWAQLRQKNTNCAFIETESTNNLQRTVPWVQTLNALGTTLIANCQNASEEKQGLLVKQRSTADYKQAM